MSKQNIEDIYPLSASQQGMLFHLLFTEEKGQVYFDQYVSTLAGALDVAAFREAWSRTLERHPALRTQFLWERREQPLQVVRRDAVLPWQEHDWSHLPEAGREERLAAFLREDHDLGFDLGKPPLMRIAVIRWAADVHKLVWSFHHLVVDGWSMGLVLADAFSFYRELRAGREVRVAPPRPYRDYITWAQGQDPARAEAFWRRTLSGFDTANLLPFDGTGAGGDPTGWVAQEVKLDVPEDVSTALRALARSQQVTLNTVFQGAWSLLLSRYAASPDVMFGAIVSGRPPEIEGVESMVGLFINLLPARVDASPDQALMPWLKALQEQQIEQREYEHTPLDSVMAWSEVGRKGVLFESVLVFENYPIDALRQGASDLGLEIRQAHLSESGNFPLTLYVLPKSSHVEMRLNFHWTRISPEAAPKILEHLLALLRGLTAATTRPESRLGDLQILSGGERRELLATGRGPARETPEVPIHHLFDEQAARTPGTVALETTRGERLTYGELAAQAGALARHLRSLGVGPESIVGLCVERSPEMVIGMLGVLKAGGAYLPLDPTYPQDRLAFMLEDSGARLVLTRESLESNLPASAPPAVRLDGNWSGTAEALPEVDPRHPAYVIYTSGSTGRPKGVLVPHSSLVNYVRHAGAAYGIGAGDRVLQFASMSFDTSAEEIYPCLTGGGTLVLRDDEMAGSLDRFSRDVERLGITVLDLPTAYWHELVAEMAGSELDVSQGLRVVILGGEEAQADRVATWRERVGGRVRLINTYGPTEATIVSTHCDVTPETAAAPVPIGRAVPNARAYVLDRSLDLVPPGVVGELYLGGAGLARGYLGRPELTAERFLPDVFAQDGGLGAGSRLYRTGDLARLRPDGNLEFRGRADGQVKVRGFRIELGEIESALRHQAGVRDAVVLAREDVPGQKRLVAYAVPVPGMTLAVPELRQALKDTLPDYMVPAAFVVLEALPMTPTGKVDRRALPVPDTSRPEIDASYLPPNTPVQQMLAEMWSDLLGVERVGVHDDFFQLGGHSLLVAKLSARIRQTFKVELSLIEVFKNPTVARLAEAVEQPGTASELPELPPIRRAPRDQPIPLSYPQERVWFLDQLTPGGNIAYNFQVTLWFRGPLRVDVLDRALTELVRRHEVLRTSFPSMDGRPVQVVHEPWRVSLPVIDLRGLPLEVRGGESERLVFESTQTPFDIARSPLIRWRMLRLQDDLWELIQVEHHFIHDGWTFGVLLREVKALYAAFLRGEPSPLPELPVQYADFAVWQREWLEGEPMQRLLGFWTRKLAAHPAPTEISTDHPRPARGTFRGDVELLGIPSELYVGLRRFSRRQGFTLYMTMLAGFFSLLHRYSGQEDLMIGTSNANRRAREIEGMIGMFVNTLILRCDLSGQPTFRQSLDRVRDLTLEVHAHQDMPFERLVQELRPERQLGRNPLFQIMYNFHDAAVPDLEIADLQGAFRVRGNRSAKVDLNVIVVPRGEQRVGLEEREEDRRAVLHWEYNTDLFDRSTMLRMVEHYQTLLAGAIENPGRPLSELPLLGEAETAQLLREWSRTGPAPAGDGDDEGGDCLHELFEAQAARAPGATAVVHGRDRLTYGELNRRANRLAHRLRALGVGPEVRVGIFLDRSADLVVALLATLKAGGAYVPLDPAYPRERVAFMLEDSGAPVLVTRSSLEDSLPEHRTRVVRVDGETAAREDDPVSGAGAGSLAYQLYTSGSTGRPKAVALEHRSAVAFARWAREAFSPAELKGVLASTSVCFDLSVFELFVPLAWGGTVILAANALELPALPAAGEVTLVNTVPSAMAELVRARALPPSVRTVNLAGEPLRNTLAQEIYATSAVERVLNLYGPSEDTTYSTYALARRASEREPTIGRPLPGTRAYVADRAFHLAPLGVPGELLLGGIGLARGYSRRPELTAARFVPDPWGGEPGERLYRTGDLARFRPDGELEYLGRVDHQVKVRGFRIELGEIEAALARVPGVREAVVLVREDPTGDRRLVAYVVPEGEGQPTAQGLRETLSQRLPAFMVPSDFVALDHLPLTPSGKVDRRALPDPDPTRREDEASYVAPRNPVEEALAAIWTDVLGAGGAPVGVRDDFFALGGHSLSAARMLSRVRDHLRVELALPVVFERRTIERMAELVAASGPAAVVEPGPAQAGDGLAGLMVHAAALSDAELDSLLEEMLEGENA